MAGPRLEDADRAEQLRPPSRQRCRVFQDVGNFVDGGIVEAPAGEKFVAIARHAPTFAAPPLCYSVRTARECSRGSLLPRGAPRCADYTIRSGYRQPWVVISTWPQSGPIGSGHLTGEPSIVV